MSFRSWLDEAHISESELAAMLNDRAPLRIARQPIRRWLNFDATQTVIIRPPEDWAYEIISIMIYAGSVPAANVHGTIDITQYVDEVSGDISNFAYNTPVASAASGGSMYWNITGPGSSHYSHAGSANLIVQTPMPYRYLYGAHTMTISFIGATWAEGLIQYREVQQSV